MKIVYIQPQTTIGKVGAWGNVMSISLPYNPGETPTAPRGAPKAKTV